MTDFKDPKINISKVYTKGGDKGYTYLIGGEKVSKDDIRVISYGEVDELNVCIGVCSNLLKNSPNSKDFTYFIERLTSIQNELFNLGTVLAATGSEMSADLPRVTQEDIHNLEQDIDKMNEALEPLDSFTLPGGNEVVLAFHQARVVCRRSERNIVTVINKFSKLDDLTLIYANRLSDYLFVLGREVSSILSCDEELWSSNNITSKK
jgi:cob(I)alamin adenosyltransferase